MASARVVANRLIQLAEADGRGLTPMQILKLVYIAHGWKLGLYGRPLIPERVEAWRYGPVIPDLYRAMRGYGSDPVRAPLPVGFTAAGDVLGADDLRIIDDVYRLYGEMDGIALSRITHARNTPWEQSYEDGVQGCLIPDELIAEHYARLSRERAAPRNG